MLSNNKGKSGGAITAYGASSMNRNAIMNLYNSVIKNNEASAVGGGIYLSDAVGTIYDTTIDNNQANGVGGGSMYISNCDATFKNTIISNNKASGTGGGFHIRDDSIIIIRQTSFTDNDATNGDDIYTHNSPTISLINTYFKDPNIYESGSPTWKTCSNNLCTEDPFTSTWTCCLIER